MIERFELSHAETELRAANTGKGNLKADSYGIAESGLSPLAMMR